MNFLTVTAILWIPCIFSSIEDLPAWHMKPLGSHRQPDKVDETFADNLISPQKFANDYVLPRKPLVFRNIVKEWPAFKLWTDEYLADKYGEMELRIEGKKEKHSKIPQGDICLGRDRMKTFLNQYKKGADKYVVSELPTPMWHEVLLPASTSCGDFLTNFVEIDLWMNSDLGKKGHGGNSILHKDAFNTINCVVSGKKDWKLIELKYNDNVYQSWEGPMDQGYGGFSLINPSKVDAKRFPKIGEIPWQLTTINEGDCLYLPSQMWHQVKSYGENNRAVAFLFSQFEGRKELNLTNCSENHQKPVPLSEVDVDLQYPGTGVFFMGHNELEAVMEDLNNEIVDKNKGYITKRSVYRFVYLQHREGFVNKEIVKDKTMKIYEHLLSIAGGNKQDMNKSFVASLKRAQVRPMYPWIFPTEPASAYTHEYSYFTPEEVRENVLQAIDAYEGKITKEQFLQSYKEMGGSEKLGQEFWGNLAGDAEEVSSDDITKNLDKALGKYEYYRREDPEQEDEDEDAVIITPQGHQSRPKHERGGYEPSRVKDETEKVQVQEKKDEL